MSGGATAGPDITRASVWRTAVALVVLCAFWAGLAHAYWPEMAPALLRAAQSVRGIGAQTVDSAHLAVRNNSSADDARLQQIVAQLDADCEAIQALLARETDYRIPVLIVNGRGLALTDGVQMIISYDHGSADLSVAPFLLVLLGEGEVSVPGLNLFVEGGYAVYVAEEVGRATPLLGQPTDAWVVRMSECGTLLSLADAWAVDLPQGEREMVDAVRALLQAGSFMGWVADTHGLGAVQALRDGLSLMEATGMSFDDAERAWLAEVVERRPDSRPCAEAVPAGSLLYGFCDQLDGGAEEEPHVGCVRY